MPNFVDNTICYAWPHTLFIPNFLHFLHCPLFSWLPAYIGYSALLETAEQAYQRTICPPLALREGDARDCLIYEIAAKGMIQHLILLYTLLFCILLFNYFMWIQFTDYVLHIRLFVHICMPICVCVCTHVYACTRLFVCLYVCTLMCPCMCVYICVCLC